METGPREGGGIREMVVEKLEVYRVECDKDLLYGSHGWLM